MRVKYHFTSTEEINAAILEAIKIAFKGKSILLTIEEETDETEYLMSDPINKARLLRSIEQDKNGEYISVTIPVPDPVEDVR